MSLPFEHARSLGDAPFGAAAIAADLRAVRERAPLVHNTTNFVVMQQTANALLERLRTIGLAGTELARAQVWILRCRLLKVGAVIVRNTRRIRVLLASAFPHQAAFRLAAQRFAFG